MSAVKIRANNTHPCINSRLGNNCSLNIVRRTTLFGLRNTSDEEPKENSAARKERSREAGSKRNSVIYESVALLSCL